LWQNALQNASAEGATMERSHSWKGWAGVAIRLSLIIIGAIGILFCPNEIGIRFSDAIFIAGVLTVAVDPFLKRRLLKEASKDIFHHLLGFDLPLEIRETLRDFLLHNRHYRENVIIDVTVTPLTNGTEVELTVTVRADVVAVANTTYKQQISFEEAEHGTILEASVTSQSHSGKSYTEISPQLDSVPDESMTYAWTGREIKLKSDERLNTFIKFRMQKPIHDFWMLNFGITTVHPTVHVNGNPGLTVTASKADQVNRNEHIYRKVFVPGDHLQIRWKPTGETSEDP
jgi:hypothetical protein